MKGQNKLMGVGLLTSISASLCCITPILALVAGTGGVAASFSWIEPFRPYLIGLTIVVLGFAWYQKFQKKKATDCQCETDEKSNFLQSKLFLGIATVLALTLLALPYYSEIFYGKSANKTLVVDPINTQTAQFDVIGMTCQGCENSINLEVNKLNGIIHSKSSYENGEVVIEFNKEETSIPEIEKALNSTGYSATLKTKTTWKSN